MIVNAPPPAYWISRLAEGVAELIDHGQFFDVSVTIKREAEAHGNLDPKMVSKWVAQEWDRLGVKLDRRAILE